jgi:hypothetical protein
MAQEAIPEDVIACAQRDANMNRKAFTICPAPEQSGTRYFVVAATFAETRGWEVLRTVEPQV